MGETYEYSCAVCGREISQEKVGRPRLYCSAACRMLACRRRAYLGKVTDPSLFTKSPHAETAADEPRRKAGFAEAILAVIAASDAFSSEAASGKTSRRVAMLCTEAVVHCERVLALFFPPDD